MDQVIYFLTSTFLLICYIVSIGHIVFFCALPSKKNIVICEYCHVSVFAPCTSHLPEWSVGGPNWGTGEVLFGDAALGVAGGRGVDSFIFNK